MIDTRNKRAAALGFGLASLLVLPAAAGAISIEMAGHALSAYAFDLPDLNLFYDIEVTAEGVDRPTITSEASARATVATETVTRPSVTSEAFSL